MRSVSVRLADLDRLKINLGFAGENEHTHVLFDCKKAFDQYPNATPFLIVTPPRGDIYPVVVTRDGDIVEWVVTDSDLIYHGNGKVQLQFKQGDIIMKSYEARTSIAESSEPTGTTPTPVQRWIAQANEILAAIPDDIAAALAEAKASGEFDGADGVGIAAITLKSTVGLVDTYTITLTDGNTYDFDVTNGAPGQDGDDGVGIQGIAKTSTVGLVDTYTITLTNGQTYTFTVTNGQDSSIVIDDVTPASDKVFSSAKVDEELTDVKSAIQGVEGSLVKTKTANNVTEWEQGTFNAVTGAISSSSSVIRTKKRIGTEFGNIICASGYVMNIYGYDKDGTYMGVWKKSSNTFVKDGVAWYDSANILSIAGSNRYTFQITLKLSAGGSVVPSAASNISMEILSIKNINDEADDTKESIQESGDGEIINGFVWGTINGANGMLLSDSAAIRSMQYMPDGVISIESADSYVFYIFAYDKISGEYVGCWDKATRTFKKSIEVWYNNLLVTDLKASAYNLLIVVKKSNGGSFAISDAIEKLSITVNNVVKLQQNVDYFKNKEPLIAQEDNIVPAMTTLKHETKTGYISPLALLHFSDIHNDTENYPFIINFKKAHPEINDMLNTGDIMALDYNAGQALAYFSAFNSDNYALLAVGNHDCYSSGSTKMSQSTAYGYYIAPTVEAWGAEYTENKTYWYKDYDDSGIRLIGIDNMLEGSDMTAQVAWLEGVLADAKTNSLAVIIAGHCPPTTQTGVKIDSSFTSYLNIPSSSDIDALDEHGTGIMSAVDSFMNNGGEFVCYLMGHWHLDFLMYSSLYPNQLIIDIGTSAHTDGPNAYADIGQKRDVGTLFQHLFNVFTVSKADGLIRLVRIGADRDMRMKPRKVLCYDYKNHTLIYSE